jgi:TRAP-type C4-dicarboxylate transport system permease small subunit
MTEPGGPAAPQPAGQEAARWLLVSVPRFVMALLVLVAIGINVANVIGRYVFDFALFWAEEILIFITLWCVGLGIVVAAYQGAHLRMDLFSSRLPRPWRLANNALTAAIFLAVCVFGAVQSSRVVALVYHSHQVSVAASVPVVIPHSALLLGFSLMAVAVLVRLRAYLNGEF